MRKKDVEKISDVVSAILRMQGLETPLNEARAVNAWSEVVGERVANATGNVRIYNQVLRGSAVAGVAQQSFHAAQTACEKD